MKDKSTASLSIAARSAIVSTFVDAYNTADNVGSVVTLVCDKARSYLKGEAINDEDRKGIASAIAKARGWKPNVLKQRTSEVNVILRAYAELPAAIAALSTKARRVHWHDSMKLARRLNAGDTVAKAVAFAMRAGTTAEVLPSARVAGALRAWWKAAPNKRAAIMKAAELLNVQLRGLES